ncbi:MAG: asparaginase [Candidatus Paralactobacillus gallistercoris]|uniref:asparaginase n=1 Tax=Candidatus Paralactobacillus gallistercoris TaxID=2838724 RepID=A0A948X0Z7_9LACO|nr:asparaginase [Candidatus Paralactobacillus gallistercoris]
MKKILIIHTGGTIAMTVDNNNVAEPSAHNPLIQEIKRITSNDVSITSEILCNLPSNEITPAIMLQLAQRIQKAEHDGFDGIIVTHGTDTLEETAYFLDLVLPNRIPVVVTGAMRAANAVGADGLHNIQSAIWTILSPTAYNQGVMVVLNDEIHAARYVTKTHTTNVATFKSPLTGPLGIIADQKAVFLQTLTHHAPAYPLTQLKDKIYILTTYTGMDSLLLDAIDNKQTNGVVIEGVGAGNVAPAMLPGIYHLLAHHIPIILVSRCINGFAEAIYGNDTGGANLQKDGIIICQGLNGAKARIKLMVGLSIGKTGQELANFMHDALS